jgi:hypothetical protein
MSKDFDGGISTGPFNALTGAIENLQQRLLNLTLLIAQEEHNASLVDEHKLNKLAGKSAEIISKREIVENLIGKSVDHGLLNRLTRCSESVQSLQDPLQQLKDAYEPVLREPTPSPVP